MSTSKINEKDCDETIATKKDLEKVGKPQVTYDSTESKLSIG